MSVKTYSTPFGLFSVVVSTSVYDNLTTNSDVETFIPWNLINASIAINVDTYKADAFNVFTSIVPLTILKKLNVSWTETHEEYYTVDGDKKISVATRYYDTPADLRLVSKFSENGNHVQGANGFVPYGVFSTQRSGDNNPDFIRLEVLISNDEMNAFKCGSLIVNNDGEYTFSLVQLTTGDPELSPNEFLTDYFDGLEPIIETDDPYSEGGTTGTGGGTGTFSGTGDAIAIPSLPTLSAVDAGFITLFNPSIAQLGSLASYMWSDLFDIDGWRKIFADPMNAILGLSIVPVNVPSGNVKTVKVGNISTGVSMTVASSQYVEVDCGTLNVQEFWGAYLDYDPYTKAEIYLPYIGTHALAVDDIMGKSVHVVYHVDVLSGACCAYVQCGGTVLYTFIGQCSSSIPITGDNWTNVINGAISIAGSIGSMVATGGVSAPMEIGNIASTAVNTMKPSVEKSGAMGGTGGMMGVQTPYLILTRPRQALPARQNTFTGYPSFITEQLSTLSGYTEVFKIHLENVPATEQELSEIETLLKTGVIF